MNAAPRQPPSDRAPEVPPNFLDSLTRWLSGERLEPIHDALVRWAFLRALGGIYLIAFASFGVQIVGLVGSRGILPVGAFLQAMHDQLGARAYWLVPTVFWLNSSDLILRLASLIGAILALLLMLGFSHRLILIGLFLGYLSLVSAGQDFMAFQWDSLLLEAGFLAIFLDSPSSLVLWLFRWLLFRLVFLSGVVKLLSGDPTWRSLTALNYHYATQPLPTVFGWFIHQLPGGFHRASVVAVFVVELVIPFLIFLARPFRCLAAAAIVFLQLLIFLTGNYAFFNLLTIALCLFLLDEVDLRRALPPAFSDKISEAQVWRKELPVGRAALLSVAVTITVISFFQVIGRFTGGTPEPVRSFARLIAPFRIVNPYGLFAVMTTTRPEIIVEGSNDGQTWAEYTFKYKPGDLRRPPVWVQPHQPRLDWQMWFAALGSAQRHPWFGNLMVRLLQGSPDVLALLDRNPFPQAPPRYVRALLYNYMFTDLPALRAEGAWWKRELLGGYFPAITLDDVQ